ncbi:sugar translocase [Neobacillus sp. 179-C4.2 HS]|uniref:Sugar translocase n=1 Tax=Neobacillus driksii TaxID=3035913 RepID=A0ABV4Z0P1_9BACI|nr:sugar translocase [Neobacillus sp. 179.-C4.2 HS]MDP5195975.1 sugar translocase [Neobacillus sp. 179.-C4.2 HS]
MRVENSLKNIIYGITGQLLSSVMGFIVRTVIIYTLGIEYVGIEGLFSSILIMLSLTNLGFDTAIIYSLYKPLAENNYYRVRALMNLYKKAYRIIGIIVLVIGLTILPFLPYLMNGKTHISNINIIYLLLLINSVSSYYFVYKQSIIIADQRNHIISKIHSLFIITSNLFQIAILLFSHNFIFVLTIQIMFRMIENLFISKKADNLYPYLNEKNNDKLTKEERKEFFGDLYALLLYKVSGVMINGTDNIIISKFLGIYIVGIYSNYLLIISTINTFLGYLFYSITASIGNLNVNESPDKKHLIFNVLNFANFWIFGVCTVVLWNLINPFITLWVGNQFVFSNYIVFAILLNFYTTGLQTACTSFRETTGLFKKGKYRPIIAAIVNLLASLYLVQKIGVAGVLWGTVISRLLTYFWYDPYVIFKYVFQRSVKKYFIKYIFFLLLVFISAIITNILGNLLDYSTLINVVIRGSLSLVIPNILFFILFRKSEEFNYLLNIIRKIGVKSSIYRKKAFN